MLFGDSQNDVYNNTDAKRQAVINLIIAGARSGLPMFKYPDLDWQELNAELLIDACITDLKRSMLRDGSEDRSFYDYFAMNIEFCGVRKRTKRLKFQWVAVNVQLDIDKLYTYITSVLSTSARAKIHIVFNNRIKDSRYIFATASKCKVPETLEDYYNMNSETFALMFDWLMGYLVSHWTVSTARFQDFTTFRDNGVKARRSRGARLQPWLIELPFTSGDEFNRFFDLAEESIKAITQHVVPVWANMGRSLGVDALLKHSLPREQREKLNQLLEEHNEIQRSRQPEALPEGMGCDAGSEGAQGAATEHLHTA